MRRRLRSVPEEGGIILCVCSIILFGVALMIGAAQRSLDDSISLSHGHLDRRLARRAADAALDDAANTLLMTPDQLGVDLVQGSFVIGGISGRMFPYGGHLQSRERPSYWVERLNAADIHESRPNGTADIEIYRITARGTGYAAHTETTLQAEFELYRCPPRTFDDNNAATQEGENDGRCMPGLRQLSRRELQRR